MNPTAPACGCGESGCQANGGGYYVSILRDGRRMGLLLGPFETHGEALGQVRAARVLAERVDPWAAFDAIGTVRMRDGYQAPGVLNSLTGQPS